MDIYNVIQDGVGATAGPTHQPGQLGGGGAGRGQAEVSYHDHRHKEAGQQAAGETFFQII